MFPGEEPVFDPAIGVPVGAGAEAAAEAGGLREHMGAAHTEARGRAAKSESGSNIVAKRWAGE